MADCVSCGTKAGLGKKLCAPCSAQEAALQEQRRQEELQREREAEGERRRREREEQERLEEARRQRWAEFVSMRVGLLDQLLDQRVTPYLYRVITLDSQSYFHESPNPNSWWNFKTQTKPVGAPTTVDELQRLGWQGWELIGLIPISLGSVLYNNVGGNTVNAAAYGGLVVGAQALLRLPISKDFLRDSRDVVVRHLATEFPG